MSSFYPPDLILYVLVLIFLGLGIADIAEARKNPDYTGQAFFGVLFLVASVALVLVKAKSG